MPRGLWAILQKRGKPFDESFFSLDSSKFSTAIFLYAKRALGYTTKKEANHLARDFFVRQSKHFEAAL